VKGIIENSKKSRNEKIDAGKPHDTMRPADLANPRFSLLEEGTKLKAG